jgi:NAD(P)-dependent dehydrogenase (short-subunit alcohol dehydrogenase family)
VGVTGFSNISPYASSKGALEALAKCLRVEYRDAGVSFHILHPPLTRTASSAPLPVPAEFKADPEKVGKCLARHIHKKRFVICHSATESFQTWLAYRFPLAMGSMIDKMTKRAADR